jgi:hypothetical protein
VVYLVCIWYTSQTKTNDDAFILPLLGDLAPLPVPPLEALGRETLCSNEVAKAQNKGYLADKEWWLLELKEKLPGLAD